MKVLGQVMVLLGQVTKCLLLLQEQLCWGL